MRQSLIGAGAIMFILYVTGTPTWIQITVDAYLLLCGFINGWH